MSGDTVARVSVDTGHAYGVRILLNGHPVGWFPARWAHACDDSGEPIPGVEPQRIRIEARAGSVWGIVDPWPGVPTFGVGISDTADGDVTVRIPIGAVAQPGDTINIGPVGWFPARWAHACDDSGEPIPGVEPQRIRIQARAGSVWGIVDPWPGVPTFGVGISDTADGDVTVRIPIGAVAQPGDTINIGPLSTR